MKKLYTLLYIWVSFFISCESIEQTSNHNSKLHSSSSEKSHQASIIVLKNKTVQPKWDPNNYCFVTTWESDSCNKQDFREPLDLHHSYFAPVVPFGEIVLAAAPCFTIPVVGQVASGAILVVGAIGYSIYQLKEKNKKAKRQQNNTEKKNDDGGGGGGGPEKDPLPEDNRCMMMHIFCKKEGHLLDTPGNRSLLRELVSDIKNYLGTDSRYLREWYVKITKDGKQLWAWMQNGKIRDGGLNNQPLQWNSVTGLCSPTIPKK